MAQRLIGKLVGSARRGEVTKLLNVVGAWNATGVQAASKVTNASDVISATSANDVRERARLAC